MIALKNELSPWALIENLDTICLGCTHFPLIKDEIQICLPQVKNFMDPGFAIAKRLQFLLNKLEARSQSEMKNQVFCTQNVENKHQLEQALALWGFDGITVLK